MIIVGTSSPFLILKYKAIFKKEPFAIKSKANFIIPINRVIQLIIQLHKEDKSPSMRTLLLIAYLNIVGSVLLTIAIILIFIF